LGNQRSSGRGWWYRVDTIRSPDREKTQTAAGDGRFRPSTQLLWGQLRGVKHDGLDADRLRVRYSSRRRKPSQSVLDVDIGRRIETTRPVHEGQPVDGAVVEIAEVLPEPKRKLENRTWTLGG